MIFHNCGKKLTLLSESADLVMMVVVDGNNRAQGETDLCLRTPYLNGLKLKINNKN